ncbi:hypothetical protein B0H34DRAFT_783088 [Crassisporium funariophilum]|nr:hypothetical protein B0H34DRAFT_783088 [Crassisporium funariophilum]
MSMGLLAKGGNSPGHYYIHCISCNYHYTFPKSACPHPPPQSLPPLPLATHDSPPSSWGIDCASFDQLTSRQQGKLAVPTAPTLNNDLPPFDAYNIAVFNAMTAHDPILTFFEREKHRAEAKHLQNKQVLQLEDAEEEQYQAAIAASLAVARTTPHVNGSASSSQVPSESDTLFVSPFSPTIPSPTLQGLPSGSRTPAATPLLQPSMKPTTAVCTMPYQASATKPGIKAHMTEVWMRPELDNTKQPKRRNRINLNNTFSLVFWHMDGKPPKRRAIHDCPLWPKWILMDAVNICKELDIQAFLLEYFDVRSLQWITCTWSYPHTVKKDGFLLLRLLGTECLGLNDYIQESMRRDTHLQHNMTAERTSIKKQLQQRRAVPQPHLVHYVSDNNDNKEEEVVFVSRKEPLRLKREVEEDADVNPRPSQCQRLDTESTPHHLPLPPFTPTPPFSPTSHCLPLPPFLPSPSPTISSMASPCPMSPTMSIHNPETSKWWPAGMYVIDMSIGFHQVNELKTLLDERLLTVFRKKIPPNTYRDQR